MTDSQDRVLKRVQELRDQVECEKTDKAHLELKLAEKDKMIESLKNQVRIVNDNLTFFFNLNKY